MGPRLCVLSEQHNAHSRLRKWAEKKAVRSMSPAASGTVFFFFDSKNPTQDLKILDVITHVGNAV